MPNHWLDSGADSLSYTKGVGGGGASSGPSLGKTPGLGSTPSVIGASPTGPKLNAKPAAPATPMKPNPSPSIPAGPAAGRTPSPAPTPNLTGPAGPAPAPPQTSWWDRTKQIAQTGVNTLGTVNNATALHGMGQMAWSIPGVSTAAQMLPGASRVAPYLAPASNGMAAVSSKIAPPLMIANLGVDAAATANDAFSGGTGMENTLQQTRENYQYNPAYGFLRTGLGAFGSPFHYAGATMKAVGDTAFNTVYQPLASREYDQQLRAIYARRGKLPPPSLR